jgi:transcriptional regulator with GAF, ATPase, and Fis domain
MTSLEVARPTIQRLVSVLSKALGVEVAVIDEQCHLVASTGTYVERKGRDVHAPFVREVLVRGEVIASEPGRMNLCVGCRFQERCPATVEISSCIRGEHTSPLGVLSLTSFTDEGRRRLNRHRDVFQDLLNELSGLIAAIAEQTRAETAIAGAERASSLRRVPRRPDAVTVVTLDDIKGESPAIRSVKESVGRVARGTSTILLMGETGTGKEMFARAIHHLSDRRAFPFVAVNCAGFPETLLESELFGYEEGAFTGARKGGNPADSSSPTGGPFSSTK